MPEARCGMRASGRRCTRSGTEALLDEAHFILDASCGARDDGTPTRRRLISPSSCPASPPAAAGILVIGTCSLPDSTLRQIDSALSQVCAEHRLSSEELPTE